jgi:NitT/TauT family transport system permease protein
LRRVGGLVAALLLWELVAWLGDMPTFLLPRPTVLVDSFLLRADVLASAAGVLLVEAAIAFVIGNSIGVGLAFLVNRSVVMRATLMPMALAIRSVPVVAITPAMTLAIGFGHQTVIAIGVLACFFPTFVNVSRGLRATSAAEVQLFKLYDSSDWNLFWKLRFKTALPYLFQALKITVLAAMTATMIAEYVASQAGLGYLIHESYTRYRYIVVWQVVIVATLLKVVLFMLVGMVERRVVHWHKEN